jgi:tRNA (cmo5U34)-methyltransferase
MTNSTAATFNAHAPIYDQQRRRLIPCFDDFYGTAIEALALGTGQPKKILDLGAGTGLLSRHIRAAFPDAELTLLDLADGMLAGARQQFGESASYVVADLTESLPEGPWDAVASALAIHHLEDADKRDLFERIHAELKPGGVFVNAEQVAGPTPYLEKYNETWQHDRAMAAGASEQDWADAMERMRHDRCATVEEQLGWLREAGFAEADCLFKNRRFAVLVARKPS